MIHDLDKSLEELLKRELPSAANISFDTPDDKFDPGSPAVNLFLYDVRENRELRSNQWLVERQDNGMVTTQRPPVRLDCSYLITAWASDAQNEHLLLSQVIKVLLRYPTIPPEVLKGSLEGQEPPLPASTLQPGHLQSVAEFWQALGGKPRAALSYTVTIGVEPFEPEEAPAVFEHITRMKLGTDTGEGP